MRPSTFRRAFVLGALLCATATFAGNYSQPFSATPANWSVANDTWSVVANEYRNAQSDLPPSLAWYNGASWTRNFTLKVDAKSDWPAEGNELGVVFGLTDSTHYFQVLISMDGQVDLYQIVGDPNSRTTLASYKLDPAAVGLQPGEYFAVEVFVNGNTVTVRVKQTLAIARKPITPVTGKIGVIARANHARFQNLTLTDNGNAEQLFRGNFTSRTGGAIDLSEPDINCTGPTAQDPDQEKSCYANITGLDTSGFTWPARFWSDGDQETDDGGKLHYHSRSLTGEVTDFVGADIESYPGHAGPDSHVLHQWLIKREDRGNGQSGPAPQIPYAIRPRSSFQDQHDLYARFWLKYPGTLTGYWQMPWQFVTNGTFNAGDPRALRVSLLATPSRSYNYKDCGPEAAGHWHWLVQADSGPPQDQQEADATVTQFCNAGSDVPMNRWFKVEIFWHRAQSTSDLGRIWVAIDGHEVIDTPDNKKQGFMYAAGSPIDRVNLPQMYGGDAYPREQYVDDLEIWSTFPENASADEPN